MEDLFVRKEQRVHTKGSKVPSASWRILGWVTIFAVAMGYLETSVVVYMRALLYPKGFAFPLAPIPTPLAVTEIIREAATLIMLGTLGILCGRNRITRFAYFLYAFAVWDLFYYAFLKMLLNWPESFHTWDILFLIPVTWVGPVLSPVLVSLTMIWLAILILYFDTKHLQAGLRIGEFTLLAVGSLVLMVAFTWDYSAFILRHYSFCRIWTVPTNDMLKLAQQYIPEHFNWFLFSIAELIICSGIVLYFLRMKKTLKSQVSHK